MVGVLQPLLFLAIVAVVAWFALSPRLVFRIRIVEGSPRLTKGKVARDLLSQLAAICHDSRIKRGWIGGVHRGGRLTLVFSRNMPAECRQQIRNLWINS